MSLRNEIKSRFPDVYELYDLDKPLRFYDMYNQSKDLPYHNALHVESLIYTAIQIAKANPEFYLAREDLIAMIFHDFNHTGRPGPDRKNIEKAIGAAVEYMTHFEDMGDGRVFNGVLGAIYCTEYKPEKEFSDLTYRNFVRDLDVCGILGYVYTPITSSVEKDVYIIEDTTSMTSMYSDGRSEIVTVSLQRSTAYAVNVFNIISECSHLLTGSFEQFARDNVEFLSKWEFKNDFVENYFRTHFETASRRFIKAGKILDESKNKERYARLFTRGNSINGIDLEDLIKIRNIDDPYDQLSTTKGTRRDSNNL